MTPLHVTAEIHDDTHTLSVPFNAAPYFEQLSDRELVEFINTAPSADEDTDAIALHLEDLLPDVGAFFRMKAEVQPFSGETNGFEVTYEMADVIRLARDTRPDLRPIIDEAEQGNVTAEMLAGLSADPREATHDRVWQYTLEGQGSERLSDARIHEVLSALGLRDLKVTAYPTPVYPAAQTANGGATA